MKIFLSLGFRDKIDYDIICEITDMKDKIIASAKWCNIDPDDICFVHNFLYEPKETVRRPSVECLGEAIKKMADCDLVVFSIDWRSYRGCRIEHGIAHSYHIPTDNIDSFVQNPHALMEVTKNVKIN